MLSLTTTHKSFRTKSITKGPACPLTCVRGHHARINKKKIVLVFIFERMVGFNNGFVWPTWWPRRHLMNLPNKVTQNISNSFVDAGNVYCTVSYSNVLILPKAKLLMTSHSKTNQSIQLTTIFWTQVLRSDLEHRAKSDKVLIAGKKF